MKQRQMVAIGLIFCSILISLPSCFPRFFQKEKPKRPYSGAFSAMADWSESRVYPGSNFPAGALLQGFQQMRGPMMRSKMDEVGSWQSLGPTNRGGRTLAIEVDPQNDRRIYAGSASGGLWRSQNGGADWERVETGWPVHGVAAIAIQPDNPDVIYIGTGEVYGYRTAFPGVGDRITRGSYGIGLLKSTDGGLSWELSLDWQTRQERGIQDILVDPDHTNRVWAATTEGVYRSDDAGQSWNRVMDVVMATSLALMQNGNVLVACGGFASKGHGIYRSKDDGQSWQKVFVGLPATFKGKTILEVSAAERGVVYASIGDGYRTDEPTNSYLFRSTDFGTSWSQITNFDHAAWQGWYSHFIRVDPKNPNVLHLGGIVHIISRDRGLSWEEGSLGVDLHTMTFDSQGNIFVGSDQGIARSTSGGDSWTYINQGYQTVQFYNGMAQSQFTRDLFVGAPQDHTGSPYYNGSPDWQSYDHGHEGSYTLLDPNDPEIQYFSQPFFDLFERVGFGETDPQSNPPLFDEQNINFISPTVISPSNPSVLYIGRNDLVRTDDQARSWVTVNNGMALDANPILVMGISYQDSARLYVATAPRTAPFSAYRTDDSGASWSPISAGLPDRYPTDLVIDPVDDSIAYISFSGFGSSHLFKTTDSGATWIDIDRGQLPDIPTGAVAIDPANRDILYVGNDLGVFASTNGGKNWFNWSKGLPGAVMISDLHIYNPDRIIRVGTHGNGAFERALIPAPASVETPVNQYILPELGGSRNPLVGIVNLSNATATVHILSFDTNGTELAHHTQSLAARARMEGGIGQWSISEQASWLEVRSEAELSVYAELSGPSELSAYPAVQPSFLNYMPHVARDTSQFKTVLSAVNPAAAGYGAQIGQFPAERGSALPQLNQEGGSLSLDVREIFGPDLRGIEWASLFSGSQPLAAMEYFTRLPTENQTAALPLSGKSSTRLLFLHLAENTALFWTGIVYINPGIKTANLVEYHYDKQGNLLGTQNLSLPSFQKETLLFDKNSDSNSPGRFFPATSWIEVRSDMPLNGYQLFGAPLDTPHDIFAGLGADNRSGTLLSFPHLRTGQDQWTGIVCVNVGQTQARLTFSLIDQQGKPVAEYQTAIVAAREKVVYLATDLFPDQLSQGSWIQARAEGSDWAGYQLWGDSGQTRHLMAGLEATVSNEP